MYKILEDIEKERKLEPEEKAELKKYKKLADAFTPLGKAMNTEYANQNTYDCIQIHGGSGFMKDYPCERYYRDARITNIYEGTTQLQVVAAIRHVLTGTYLSQMKACQEEALNPEWDALKTRVAKLVNIYEELVPKIADTKDSEYIDFHARRLVECAGHIILSYLLLLDANRCPEEFKRSAEVYISYSEAEVNKIREFINGFNIENLAYYK
jgi:hypothetical protein